MAEKYTVEQLNKLNKKDLMLLVLSMQDQLTQMNDNLEKLIEQIRIANQQRFGRHTETLDAVSGQLSLFNEAEALSEDTMEELTIEEVLATVPKHKKQRGKRDADLKKRFFTVSRKKNLTRCMVTETTSVCRMNLISVCVTNRLPGQLKFIRLKCMSAQMGSIRMNSSGVIVQKIFLGTAL